MQQFKKSPKVVFLILLLAIGLNACKDDELVDPVPELKLSGISPETGPVGTIVTLSGKRFSEVASENEVSFNGQEAEVTEASATSLKAVVPEGATTGEIEVTVDGKAVTGPVFTVEQAEPVISGFAPENGRVGDEVTINGENFSEVASENVVTFNGKEAEVVAASETELTVTVPSRPGSGPIAVTVGETTVEGEEFEYILTVTVSTVAGSGAKGFKDGAAEEAEFYGLNGLAIDEAGNMYVADRLNHAIRKVDAQGMVTTLAGNGDRGYNDGTGDQAQFYNPTHLVLGAGGDLFVADSYNHRIRRVSTAGSVSTFAGSGAAGDTDGTGTLAEFKRPYGVVADASGNLYVSDSYNSRIRKIRSQGVVTMLAGSGTFGYADGPGAGAQFNHPKGLAVDEEGNVYVADESNHRIRKVSPAGEVSTVAGNGSAGFANGQGTAAQFNAPYDVALDSRGNLFVADINNHQIRMISSSGKVSTLAGTGAAGHADGAGNQAQFYIPSGLAMDQEGNLYVADLGNSRIRKITIE